jgi:hypothetical protein
LPVKSIKKNPDPGQVASTLKRDKHFPHSKKSASKYGYLAFHMAMPPTMERKSAKTLSDNNI